MKSRSVFSDNSWVSVPLPIGSDPSWTPRQEALYATFWAAATRLRYSSADATRLSEAKVYKLFYPDMAYGKQFEQELLDFTRNLDAR